MSAFAAGILLDSNGSNSDDDSDDNESVDSLQLLTQLHDDADSCNQNNNNNSFVVGNNKHPASSSDNDESDNKNLIDQNSMEAHLPNRKRDDDGDDDAGQDEGQLSEKMPSPPIPRASSSTLMHDDFQEKSENSINIVLGKSVLAWQRRQQQHVISPEPSIDTMLTIQHGDKSFPPNGKALHLGIHSNGTLATLESYTDDNEGCGRNDEFVARCKTMKHETYEKMMECVAVLDPKTNCHVLELVTVAVSSCRRTRQTMENKEGDGLANVTNRISSIRQGTNSADKNQKQKLVTKKRKK